MINIIGLLLYEMYGFFASNAGVYKRKILFKFKLY